MTYQKKEKESNIEIKNTESRKYNLHWDADFFKQTILSSE